MEIPLWLVFAGGAPAVALVLFFVRMDWHLKNATETLRGIRGDHNRFNERLEKIERRLERVSILMQERDSQIGGA